MRARSLVPLACFAALGALAPLVAHGMGAACWIWLPSHVPALLGGLTFGPAAGIASALATVLADLWAGDRYESRGLVQLGSELGTYAVVAGVLGRRGGSLPTRTAALLGAMLSGRLVYLAVGVAFGDAAGALLPGLFVAPWPGMSTQVLVLPALSLGLGRAVSNPTNVDT